MRERPKEKSSRGLKRKGESKLNYPRRSIREPNPGGLFEKEGRISLEKGEENGGRGE